MLSNRRRKNKRKLKNNSLWLKVLLMTISFVIVQNVFIGSDQKNSSFSEHKVHSTTSQQKRATNNSNHHIRSNKLYDVFTSASCASQPITASIYDLRGKKLIVPVTNQEISNFSMQIYPGRDFVSDGIRKEIGFENDKVQDLQKFFTEYSAKNNSPLSELTFVDIGANIGWFSFQMAAFGVQVIAFEPMLDNLHIIKTSMCLPDNIKNSISDRITLFGHGLAAENKEKCLIFSHIRNRGDGHVECDPTQLEIPDDFIIRENISVRRLDDIMKILKEEREILNVVAVKIDTEGYEAKLLEGGESFLLDGEVKRIYTEFDPRMIRDRGSDPVEFMKKILNAGYQVKGRNGEQYMNAEECMNMKNFGQGLDLTLYSPKWLPN